MNNKMVKNSLGYNTNLYVYQDKNMFNYSVDSILLGNFTYIGKGTKRMLEIGANNGALSIFMADRYSKLHIDAVEIQEKAALLAIKNVEMNNKQEQIKIINQDFNLFWKEHIKNSQKKYQAIVCNPPFYRIEKSQLKTKNITKEKLIATHEIEINLEQIIEGSSKIIEQKGYLTIVLPVERIVDLMQLLRQYKFEPKRIQFVCPRINEKPKFVLLESRFMSGWGIHFQENLYLHPNDKSTHIYNEEIIKLYKPIKIKE
ncbi:tRNA1(Val) (adenine(37)-N6)-methyltransferase [Mycoplasma sp. M5725]|uniref:tRNA1(Val) (Adenine(37)-N6)-methyltransferase n=1 Tax=Mycoplasma phocimorsus TaxID=3045839 RepID=A0AAJ1PQJ2_9MOLU|nr:tRNA1(Val) (adenine(37)-N6)-methyltransferase [Mycoplasma phocimorsus]MDJ1645497.1 tRNA1(Val) (adenine(37)-N6)-methyltransferase [Mycoplasma phocimorsus]MDJ1647940.1 tRNA1(Val) (adenine(37)-N6)-methyltransferase [Mycoplasma phocimorsus]